MRVGTKELKNRLSHYVRRVRDGEVVEITDRGTVVAEIRGVRAGRGEAAALAKLEAEGVITQSEKRLARPFKGIKLRKNVSASRYVIEDRR